jgi:hypothetical protein
MNRKEFFKKLGLGALIVAVAPKVLAKEEESHLFTYSRDNEHALSYKDAQLIADENIKAMQYLYSKDNDYYEIQVKLIEYYKNMDAKEFLNYFKQTGMLIYKYPL